MALHEEGVFVLVEDAVEVAGDLDCVEELQLGLLFLVGEGGGGAQAEVLFVEAGFELGKLGEIERFGGFGG